MKNKIRYIGAIGILGYILLIIIDKAIIKIPDTIYIPLGLLIIAILVFANNLKKIRKK